MTVARIHDLDVGWQVAALARFAAGFAATGDAEVRAPAVGPSLDAVGAELDRVEQALALEHRLDQLVKAARDDERAVGQRELGESRPDAHVLEQPRHDLLEGGGHGLELLLDHLVEGQRAP